MFYYNLIQSLENDIQIKERIINNYMLFKQDYNSYLNLKNLYMKNNEKYENMLDDILSDKNKFGNCSNNKIDLSSFINNLLSIFYYSLMINKSEEINTIVNISFF